LSILKLSIATTGCAVAQALY